MKDEKYKVSIIIPIYNDEKYLNRCLDSIINQTYKNIEIIAINDGSKDRSKEILEEYAKKYEFVKYIEQENQGIAKTRNNGIKYVTGDYIMFMDDDDYFDKDYIETYVKEITKDNLDVVVGGYKRPDENGNMTRVFKLEQTEWCKIVLCTPWAKIYSTGYIKENGFEFLNNNIGEDLYFNIQALLFSDKVKILTDYIGYNWFFNTQSVSNTLQKNIENVDIYNLLDSMYEAVKKKGILDKKYKIVEAYFIVTSIYLLTSTTKKMKFSVISREYDKLFRWLKKRFPEFTKNEVIIKDKLKGDPNSLKIIAFLKLYKMKLGKILIYVFSKI